MLRHVAGQQYPPHRWRQQRRSPASSSSCSIPTRWQRTASMCVCVLMLLLDLRPVSACPLMCDCNTEVAKKTSVSCKGQSSLSELPADMPEDVVELDLSETNLGILRHDTFSGVTRLKVLHVQNAGLTEIEPTALAPLVHLKTLDLRSNALTQLPASCFSGLTQLRRLLLANNRLTLLPDSIFFGLNIDELHLEGNPLQRFTAGTFNGSQVTTLVLNECRLTALSSASLAPLKQSLMSLSVASNAVPLAMDNQVFQQFAFGDLSLANSGLENASFLRSVAMVRTLDLHGNPLGEGLSFRDYPAMRFVEHLNLSNISSLQASLDDHFFASVKLLRHLDLSENRIDGLTTAAILRHVPNLSTLILSVNRITQIPSDLGDYVAQLESLQLAHNRISSLNGATFTELKMLHHLDLRSNLIQIYPDNMRAVFERVPFLQLHDNPMHCNCENRWFRDFLGSYRPSTGADYCNTPVFSYVWDMQATDFVCRPPTIRTISSNMTVVSGEDVLLHCQGEGDPAPRIQWSSPNGDVVRVTPSPARTVTRTSAYWTIRAITIQKSGLYRCEAVNPEGSAFSSTCINVVSSKAQLLTSGPPNCAPATTAAAETTVVTTERSMHHPEITAGIDGGHGHGQGHVANMGSLVTVAAAAAAAAAADDDDDEQRESNVDDGEHDKKENGGSAADADELDNPFKDFDDDRSKQGSPARDSAGEKVEGNPTRGSTTTPSSFADVVDNHVPHNHVMQPTPRHHHPVTSSASPSHGGHGHGHVEGGVTLTSAVADTNSSAALGKLKEGEDEGAWHVRLGRAQVAAIIACVCFVTLVAVTSVVVTLACFARRRKRFDIQSRNARSHIRWDTIRQPANV